MLLTAEGNCLPTDTKVIAGPAAAPDVETNTYGLPDPKPLNGYGSTIEPDQRYSKRAMHT